MKATKNIVENLVSEYLTKSTYEMTFEEIQDFIDKSIDTLKLELITNHLKHYQK